MGNNSKVKQGFFKIILIVSVFSCQEVRIEEMQILYQNPNFKEFHYSTLFTFEDEILLNGDRKPGYILVMISCIGTICKYSKNYRLRCYDDMIFLSNTYDEKITDKEKIIKKVVGEEIDRVSGKITYLGNFQCTVKKNTPVVLIKEIYYWDQEIQERLNNESNLIELSSNREYLWHPKRGYGQGGALYDEKYTFQNILKDDNRDKQKILSCKGLLCKHLDLFNFNCHREYKSYYYKINKFLQNSNDKEKPVKIIYGDILEKVDGTIVTSTGKCNFEQVPIIGDQKIEYWSEGIKLKIDLDRKKFDK